MHQIKSDRTATKVTLDDRNVLTPASKYLKKIQTYLIVTANKTMMTPTINMATQTPPIMYKLSFGASGIKKKL